MSAVRLDMSIDFSLLRQQKNWLLQERPDEKYPLVDGLICMIDFIQDMAVEQGVPESEVFGDEEAQANQS